MNEPLIKIQNNKYDFISKDLKNIVDLKKIIESINFDNKTKTLGNSVCYKRDNNKKIYINKNFDQNVLEFLMSHSDKFSNNEISYLSDYLETYNKQDIIILHTIELNLLLKLLNNKIITEKLFYFYAVRLDYVPKDFLEILLINIRKKNVNKKSGYYKNANILQTNKNNYEFPRDIDTLRNKEIKELLCLINLPLVEMPLNKDSENMTKFLKQVYKLKKDLNLKKFNFSLRIKKIKNKKLGMFIVGSNTMVIDPRHPEVFIHELGHYIYENKLAFSYKNKRYYPSLFENKINQFKKNNKVDIERCNLEDYGDNSEVFALFFEKLIVI